MGNKSTHIIDIKTKGAGKSKKDVKGVSGALGGLAKKAGLAAAAYFGTQGLISAVKGSVDAFARQELAEKKLDAVLKSTQNAAGMTARELRGMASALQGVTKFGDEAIIEAQSLMLTFTKVGKQVMPDAIKTILNMSEAMGSSLKDQTIQLGKALNDPILGISALSRVGVQLSDTQKQQIKDFMDVNDVASAQQVILGELETQFGGMAEAGADTLSGSMQQMSNAIGDTAEAFGNLLAPIIIDVSGTMKDLAESVSDWLSLPVTDQLKNEKDDFNALMTAIQDTNTPTDIRKKLIEDINSQYDDYLPNLIDEKDTTEELAKAREEANKNFNKYRSRVFRRR